MVWAESVGQSIVVPGDKDVLDATDKRDFIDIGSDVPPELSAYLTAGLFFRAGQYVADATYMQVKYFGMGSKNTYFFLFVYVENYKNVLGDHRLVNLSSYLFDNDYSLLSTFGPYDQNTGQPITAANMLTNNGPLRSQDLFNPVDVAQANGLRPGWVNYGVDFGTLKYWLTPDGMAHCMGLLRAGGGFGVGGASVIFVLPQILWPYSNYIFTGMANSNTAQAQAIRVDVRSNGEIAVVDTPSIPVGNYISINCSWPTRKLIAG